MDVRDRTAGRLLPNNKLGIYKKDGTKMVTLINGMG